MPLCKNDLNKKRKLDLLKARSIEEGLVVGVELN